MDSAFVQGNFPREKFSLFNGARVIRCKGLALMRFCSFNSFENSG